MGKGLVANLYRTGHEVRADATNCGQRLNLHSSRLLCTLVKRNDRDPLATRLFLKHYCAAETRGDFFGQHVSMVAKESFLKALPCRPILEERMSRLTFGGKKQGLAESAAGGEGQINLRCGEILNAQNWNRTRDIAQPWAGKFV